MKQTIKELDKQLNFIEKKLNLQPHSVIVISAIVFIALGIVVNKWAFFGLALHAGYAYAKYKITYDEWSKEKDDENETVQTVQPILQNKR